MLSKVKYQKNIQQHVASERSYSDRNFNWHEKRKEAGVNKAPLPVPSKIIFLWVPRYGFFKKNTVANYFFMF